MPKETLHAFIKALSKLPQRVFWKWEGEIPENISSNILMTKWLPQQDLLGIFKNEYFLKRRFWLKYFTFNC
jgi:glucuronosyltransferase